MDVEKLIKVYVKIRDKRAEIKSAYETEDNALKEQLAVIESNLLEVCKSTGTKSLSTDAGTATQKVETRYWTSDWDSMYRFIDEHKATHLLERRIAQNNMKEFLEHNPNLLPEGLNTDSKYVITVRRK